MLTKNAAKKADDVLAFSVLCLFFSPLALFALPFAVYFALAPRAAAYFRRGRSVALALIEANVFPAVIAPPAVQVAAPPAAPEPAAPSVLVTDAVPAPFAPLALDATEPAAAAALWSYGDDAPTADTTGDVRPAAAPPQDAAPAAPAADDAAVTSAANAPADGGRTYRVEKRLSHDKGEKANPWRLEAAGCARSDAEALAEWWQWFGAYDVRIAAERGKARGRKRTAAAA
jgi:hypothetical protein